MNYTESPYIQADNNKIINKKSIIWVKKMNDCLEICTRKIGCSIKDGTTHQICKKNNIHSYDELNQYFK